MIRHTFASFFLLSCLAGAAQEVKTYTRHERIIPNPERGYYKHTEARSTNYAELNEVMLRGYRENQGITQILRVFYLEEFRQGPISDSYLIKMRRDFAALRSAGLKAIIRFAYTTSSTAPYYDATPDMVLAHISQLQPILRENADVIATMQAGFIGAWGEWYYTDHFAVSPGNITANDWANRKAVVDALLEALPSNRTIQIRTPGYKMQMLGTQEPISAEEAFSESDIARLGHHNDCFVASSSDYGTYVNPTIEKPYLESETQYLPMGGETCNVAPPYSDCENSTYELERFHWSYLNIDYNRQVLNGWEDQGCLDEVELLLGYRIYLTTATCTTVEKQGGTFQLDLEFVNEGYANPYNERIFQIILRDNHTQEEYRLTPETDVRRWPLGSSHQVHISGGLPEEMPNGEYSVFIALRDPYPTLTDRPEFSIQLANDNIWDGDLGYNDLGFTIQVSDQNPSETYMGLHFFERKKMEPFALENNSFRGSASSRGTLLYWPSWSEDHWIELQKEAGPEDFSTIATLPGHVTNWLDTDVAAGTTASYRYLIHGNSGSSDYSSVLTFTTPESSFVTITLDGSDSDWGAAAIVGSSQKSFQAARFYFGTQKACFYIHGSDEASIFLNTDDSPSTGMEGWDYLLENSEIKEFSEDEWVTVGHLEYVADGKNMEYAVPLNIFSNLASNRRIGALIITSQDTLRQAGSSTLLYIRTLAPNVPTGLVVRNSQSLPETRLLISWNPCTNCTGYKLERKTSEGEFSLVGEYPPSTTSIFDDNLGNKITYTYRMAASNELGWSEYSAEVSGTTGPLPLHLSPALLSVFPNPCKDWIYFSKPIEKVALFTLGGQLIDSQSDTDRLSLTALPSGIYLLILMDRTSSRSLKIIKE